MTRVLTALGWTCAYLAGGAALAGNLVLFEGVAGAMTNPCSGATPNTNGWCKCNCINNSNPFPTCRNKKPITQSTVVCCNTACDAAYPSPPPPGGTASCVTDISQGLPAGCGAAQPSPCFISSTQNGTQCISSALVPWPSGGTVSYCECN